MRRIGLMLAFLGACGGSQSGTAATGTDRSKVSSLEEELEETRTALKKEKAARTDAEQALADQRTKCAAQVQEAMARAAPAAPPTLATPATPTTLVPGPATQPAPASQPALVAAKPVPARVTEKSAMGGSVRLILSAGANRGITTGWTGQLFEGKGTKVIARFKITKVSANESEGLVLSTTIQAIGANDRVELSAPTP